MSSYLLLNHFHRFDAPYENPVVTGVFTSFELAKSEVWDRADVPALEGTFYAVEEWAGTTMIRRWMFQITDGIIVYKEVR